MIESFFRIHLRAPLCNARWSWGAIRAADGAIFLRVWQDEIIKHSGSRYMRLTAHSHFADKANNLGWQERLKHVSLVRERLAPAYMVMCEATDAAAEVREIRSFDNHDVFVGGKLIDYDGDCWLEMESRKAVRDLV